MEHLGWTTARAVYAEANPRVSAGLGALGIVLALVGVLTGTAGERVDPPQETAAVETAATLESRPVATPVDRR